MRTVFSYCGKYFIHQAEAQIYSPEPTATPWHLQPICAPRPYTRRDHPVPTHSQDHSDTVLIELLLQANPVLCLHAPEEQTCKSSPARKAEFCSSQTRVSQQEISAERATPLPFKSFDE